MYTLLKYLTLGHIRSKRISTHTQLSTGRQRGYDIF